MVWSLPPHTVQTQPRLPPSNVDVYYRAPSLHSLPPLLGGSSGAQLQCGSFPVTRALPRCAETSYLLYVLAYV